MFRSCLNSALRHLARNRLYAIIGIGGLSVGMCISLLAVLILRNEYTYDHFIPGYDRTYAMIPVFKNSGLRTEFAMQTQVRFAAQLALTFPQIEATTRALNRTLQVRHGNQSTREVVYSVDTNFLDTLPMKLVAGDARTALRTPDGVVLSRQYARKLFGQDAPIGESLQVGASQMIVRGIIDDPPPNASDVQRDILAAGIANSSRISQIEHDPRSQGDDLNWNGGLTYLRLKPGASIDEIRARFPEFRKRVWPRADKDTVQFVRIDRLNTLEPMHPGFSGRMTMFGAVGVAVLFIAGANFVNLLTTRSVRRAREVAIRKLAGAGRGTLIVQFLSEAILQALIPALIALALTEWLLPQVNAFSRHRRDPGLCPRALVRTHATRDSLCAWRPGRKLSCLRGDLSARHRCCVEAAWDRGKPLVFSARAGDAPVRTAALTGYLCRHRAATAGLRAGEALRLNADQVLIVSVRRENRFVPALFDELRKFPGVLNSTRTGGHFSAREAFATSARGVGAA